MAVVAVQSSYSISYLSHKPHPHIYKSLSSFTTRKPKLRRIIISQDSSESSKPTIEEEEAPLSSKKQTLSSGQGFGSGSGSGSAQLPKSNPKKQKGRRIIRRSPVEKPATFLDNKGKDEVEVKQRAVNESAFLLIWLGFGAIILLEGIALSASGFLPEKWDKFFVKFLYPSFTPTVFLFVAGTVVYGVFKYLQNENVRNQK